jgi:nucleotidyltransferase/DNA polymerase involved in DNA repair
VARWVLHVDLDQFIAAVEVLRHPELRGRPVVVGGDGDPTKRGVVSTASYEAREHGVHSGLPLRTAAKRLPDAVFLPVDRAAYEEVSETVMEVLRSTGAVVEVLGWDEAFVGVDTEDPEGFARSLARRVREATDLDCTVGIGGNKLQAKIATGFGKPAGVFRLTSANWFSLLGGRPTDALWGIGAKTAKKLTDLGIRTVSDLAAADPDALAAVFGPMTGPWLVLLARGRGDADVDDSPYVAKGHGREETFQRNIAGWSQVEGEVARIAGLLATDLASEPRPALRVVVKVRYAPFITETHGVTLATPSSDAGVIAQAAAEALSRFTGRRPVRLLGVRAQFERGARLARARLECNSPASTDSVRVQRPRSERGAASPSLGRTAWMPPSCSWDDMNAASMQYEGIGGPVPAVTAVRWRPSGTVDIAPCLIRGTETGAVGGIGGHREAKRREDAERTPGKTGLAIPGAACRSRRGPGWRAAAGARPSR